jgi:alpha-glucoside transport system permease protein
MEGFFTASLSKFGSVASAIAIFFIVLGSIFYIAGKFNGKKARYIAITIFVGPAVALLAIGVVIPGIQTILFSFRDAEGMNFIGIDNYIWMFQDPYILITMRNTFLWLLVAPFFTTALGLLLAVALNQMRREAIPKSLLFAPMAISFVGASVIWRFLYEYRSGDTQIGLLNAIWTFFGGEPVNWMLSKPLNTFLLMVILVWTQMGFAMVILSAAIKAVPSDLTEAAALDGASGSTLFRYITFPMVKTTIVVVLATQVVGALKLFDIVETMTGGNFGTNVLANEMFSRIFVQYDQGKGSAIAVLLFIFVTPILIFNIRSILKERANK